MGEPLRKSADKIVSPAPVPRGAAYQAYRILQVVFVLMPLIAGTDKFFHILVNWDQYLAPIALSILGNHAHAFMLVDGAIEIAVGIGVFLMPRIFAYVVSAWLLGIAVNLLLSGAFYDIALRDFCLSLSAFAFARLGRFYSPRPPRPRRQLGMVGLSALALAVAAPAHAANPAQAARLSIATRGNALAYDPTQLTVHAGQPIALTFSNRADQASGLQHNWVLAKIDKKSDVVAASIQAGAQKDYVPDSPDVIAHTRLLHPGESQTVRFRAPSVPGDYQFFCTYPGHSDLLKGVLKVTP